MNTPSSANQSTAPIQQVEVSGAFKQQAGKVVFSIVMFFIVYLLLVAASIALAVGCFYAGIAIIIALPKLITIILGLGLIAVGGSVIFFLIKFIFAVSKNENPGRVEIKEAEQPRLFALIRELTQQTNTLFPKKIFLSPDVNACVFYNSGFWSMFLPVRKNLEIGLGLVNSVNMSEFKAVLAHEFGHFSQKSMKLGSFTYNVNRVIYNMLYENNSYTSFLSSWGNIHGLLAILAMATSKIAQGIQWILRKMYAVINKNYMGLSREMEFHADAIAASVAGGNNIISGLSRIEIAQNCYNSAINKAGEMLKQHKKSKNIFNNQLTIFQTMAKEHKLDITKELPDITYQFVASFSTSRVNFKNQWASHPTLEERKASVDKLHMNSEPDITRAWSAFDKPEQLQEMLTDKIYTNVTMEKEPVLYDHIEFEELYNKDRDQYILPEVYKGFYDGRYIDVKDWNLDEISATAPVKTFNEIFTDENSGLFKSVKQNESDIDIVKAIANKQIDTETFDFDGEKYNAADAETVIKKLEDDIANQKKTLSDLDKEAFCLFYHKAGTQREQLKQMYEQFILLTEHQTAYLDIANKAFETINPLYQDGNSIDFVNTVIDGLKHDAEPKLKRVFREAIDSNIVSAEKNRELFEKLDGFLNKNYPYFINGEFVNNELSELAELIQAVAGEWDNYKFKQFKNISEAQLTW
ncbi:MAG: M48 family metalloprotease [Chitinophagaceae bacterium]|nr:M48 family metalloprotease [Chitinophagaceae bacterium]